MHVKDDKQIGYFCFIFLFFYFFRELKDLKQRLDTMSHELKRKDMQIKEMQARLDTGDGCKYISINNMTSKKYTKFYYIVMGILYLHFIQVAVIHDMYLICGCVNL